MKRILFALFGLTVAATSWAQKFDEIKNIVMLRQYERAKPMIDNFLNNEKNQKNGDAWYYKGFIYVALATDSAINSDPAKASICANDCRKVAMDAFTKYLGIDPAGKLLVEEGNISPVIIYSNAFDKGIAAYNGKEYTRAYDEFKLALEAENMMIKHKLIYSGGGTPFPAVTFDTSLVLNIAASAEQAKDMDNAIKYYQSLVDVGISGSQNQQIYEFLAEEYGKKGDKAAQMALIDKALKIYPTVDYFIGIQLESVPKDAPKETLFAKYAELGSRYPGKYFIEYNHAIEIFKYLYDVQHVPENRDDLRTRLSAQIEKAIPLDKGVDANVLMVLHLSEWGYQIKDEILKIKGQKPEDQKKRNALKEESKKKLESLEPYADAAIAWFTVQPKLKLAQINNFKKMYEFKKDIAKAKGDIKKVVEMEKKIEEVNKM